MAYDEELAYRIREVLGREPDLAEKAMFGGLGFMLGGRMAVAAGSKGVLMVRIDPADGEDLVDGDLVRFVEMRGGEMRGWIDIHPEAIDTDEQLAAFVGRGAAYVRSLSDA